MCVIILAPNGFPNEEMLRAANKVNRDGAGIAWVEGNKVKFSKGNLSTDEILAYREFTKPPYLIHYRLASQGGNSYELAHPFSLDLDTADSMEGECSGVLAHNGTLSRDKWEPFLFKTIQGNPKTGKLNTPRGPWSDSKAIAYIYTVHGDAYLEWINEKVALLGTDRILRWFGPQGGDRGWNRIKEKDSKGQEQEFIVSNMLWKKGLEGNNVSCYPGGICG